MAGMFETMLNAYDNVQQEVSGMFEAVSTANKKGAAYLGDLISDGMQLSGNERFLKDVPNNTFLDQFLPPKQEQELDLFTDTTSPEVIVPEPEVVVEEPATVASTLQQVEEMMPSNGMLTEIAEVESNSGKHPNTYREGYHGGVMQVDEIGYEDTKDLKSHPELVEKHAQIKETFGIDWMDTEWANLRDPLHSAIAARLKLSNVKKPIPETAKGRAAYWKKHYNSSEGKGTAAKYLERLNKQ